KDLLQSIAAERLAEELTKLVCGEHFLPILREFGDVVGVFIPEILPCIGFDQKSRFHCYDVWEHSVRSMCHVPPQKHLRYHMMFHDLGKPHCFTEDERGGHYYGHTDISAKMAQDIMARLKFDNETRRKVALLMDWHDRWFEPTGISLRKVLSQIGPERLQDVLDAKRADNFAKRREGLERAQEPWNKAEEILKKLLEENVCVTVKQLSVDGRDMMRLGLSGKAIGGMLEYLLSAVIEERLPNEREALLAAARQTIRKDQ
ncbi:MAG: tRNA nucleotidyltransferase, partial [Oscillospiraceae bacterium]|nr:tRNA nucleotidyltransferase [Oscillospiraceae bacterium]